MSINASTISQDRKNIYDVNDYTDAELYNILDLNNPTDRELEAKITQMIHRYENMQNESGDKLAHFFHDIYTHFFETDDDEGEEEDDEFDDTYLIDPSIKKASIERFTNLDNKVIQTGVDMIRGNTKANPGESAAAVVYGNTVADPGTRQVKQMDYVTGIVNPLLKETITRVVSIDSQYRDNILYPNSSEFTFNLSEPLKDVVSVSLYSYSIPYSWYTVNNNFGANFFYLKGSKPGIDNGYHDYKIQIDAGNYTAVDIVSHINTKIQNLHAQYPDVSFGNTAINYADNNSLSTITVDIQKIYNEKNYYLDFVSTDVSGIGPYLGFTNQLYGYDSSSSLLNRFDSSFSLLTVYATKSAPVNSITITDSNNKISIYRYVGPDEYTSSSSLIKEITINDANGADIIYDLSGIYNYINTNLFSANDFINSSISTDAKTGYAKIIVNLNPNVRQPIPNEKIRIEFYNGLNPVWYGSGSYLGFDSSFVELNNILSESNAKKSNYLIGPNVKMNLTCMNEDFNRVINNYTISVAQSTVTGYNLTQYIAAINTGIRTNDLSGDFYNIIAGSPPTSVYSNADSKIQFDFSIQKKFNAAKYIMDISGTIFKDFGFTGFTDNTYDLSSGTTLTGVFDGVYTVKPGEKLIKFYLKDTYGIQKYEIDFSNNTSDINYENNVDLARDINAVFSTYTYTDPYTGEKQKPLEGTTISFGDLNVNVYPVTFNVNLTTILNQKDYKIDFIDPSNNIEGSSKNSWTYYLHLDSSYIIQTPTNIIGNEAIQDKGIVINDTNNYLYLNAKYDPLGGAYSSDGANNIKITIPNKTYTKRELMNELNNQLSVNPITQGSTFSVFLKDNDEYTKFRLNLNLIYTSNDYRIVFYDPYSFVRCYVGSKSAKNTMWDTTIGWIIGFHNYTEYELLPENLMTDANDSTNTYYLDSVRGKYTYADTLTPITYADPILSENKTFSQLQRTAITLTGDTPVNVFQYSYFMIVLDDYIQNHLNDGLVTMIKGENNNAVPFSYASRAVKECIDGNIVYSSTNTSKSINNNLTAKETYALNQINSARKTNNPNSSTAPYAQDIFGIIPFKSLGTFNSIVADYGSALASQERSYFGPVNIHRMTVKLINDRGDLVDLRGANWSFSLVCKQLYKSTTN